MQIQAKVGMQVRAGVQVCKCASVQAATAAAGIVAGKLIATDTAVARR